MRVRPLGIIAGLTLREAARRRLVLAAILLTVLIVVLTGWGFSRLGTLHEANGQRITRADLVETQAGLTILISYMFSFVLAIGGAFLASPAIAPEVESGLLLAILPRPIHRADVVAGKWLGLAILLVLYAALAAGLELGTMRVIGGYAPPHPVAAVALLAGQGLVVLTLGLLASTRLAPVTGGIIALVLFGLAWLAGIVQGIALAFGNQTLITATTVIGLVMPSDTFWRDALYNLEPAALIALAHGTHNGASLAVAAPPPLALLLWTGGWMIALLGLAIWSFGRRDV